VGSGARLRGWPASISTFQPVFFITGVAFGPLTPFSLFYSAQVQLVNSILLDLCVTKHVAWKLEIFVVPQPDFVG
jgi:hypothetical protein